MTDQDNAAAGERSPAASLSGWAERTDAPLYTVTLWPNRSLDRRGRRFVIGLTAAGLSVPLIPAFGTPVFWGLLPFLVGALGLLWLAFRRNNRDGRMHEALSLWPDEIRVERHDPDGSIRRWAANPYWVSTALRKDGPVQDYLTVTGEGREIELGAFLSPEERVSLHDELETAIARARSGAAPNA